MKLRSVFCSFDFGLKTDNKVRIIVLGPTESLRMNDFFGLTKFGLTMKFYSKQRRTKIGTRKILRNNGDFGLSVFEITVLKYSVLLALMTQQKSSDTVHTLTSFRKCN